MDTFYTYILYSEKLDKYYIGNTSSLERRLEEHNRGKSTFTKTGIPWKLMYYEVYASKTEACKRELDIKKRKSRTYIEKLFS